MKEEELKKNQAAIKRARKSLSNLCRNRSTFKMCVPVQPDDTDVIFCNVLELAEENIETIERLQEKLDVCIKHKEEPYIERVRLQNANCKLNETLSKAKEFIKKVGQLDYQHNVSKARELLLELNEISE